MKPERNELKGKVPTSTQYANWKMPKKGQSRRGGKRGGEREGMPRHSVLLIGIKKEQPEHTQTQTQVPVRRM